MHPPPNNLPTLKKTDIQLSTHTHEIALIEQSELKKYTLIGWFVIAGGLGSFLLWAALAPLDQGVPLTGNVAVASNRKAIQHEIGGTVEKIMVKDGDKVKAGDTLIIMNSVQAKADAEAIRVQYLTAKAMESRLTTEKNGRSTIPMDNKLKALMGNPQVSAYIDLQKQIANSRQSAISSELAAIDENVAGLASQIKGLEDAVSSKKEQLSLIAEQLEGMRELAKEGYMAKNKLLDTEQNYARINADISADLGNIGRANRQISELKMQKMQRHQEYQKEVRTQLSDVQRQADALENQLKGLDRNLQNIEIKSPVEGTVVGLSVFTKGAVITPGSKVMEIVPKEDSLIIEGQLPVHLVDKVHPDLPVNLLFTAFNRNKTPQIPGVVTQVSADRFVDERSGASYFKVITKVAPEGIKMLGSYNVRPGMPVDMFIVTGERTMLNYILKPIIDHLKLSMTEE